MRLFVTGTGTGVGKTVIAAALVRALGADYWKPIQSGARGIEDPESDTYMVRTLAGLTPERIHEPACTFAAPLSPHEAAAMEGREISLGAIRPPATKRPLVAEGAGGVLVPLSPGPRAKTTQIYMIDLMAQLNFPIILVAENILGTINHTLLSLEALRARKLEIVGVVLNDGDKGGDMTTNGRAIEQFGQTKVLYEMPTLARLDRSALDRVAGDLSQRLEAFA